MPNRFLLALLKEGFSLALQFDRRNSSYRAENIKSILLLNTTAIGDTLLCTPAIKALREAFPEVRITSLISPMAKEVLLNNPHIDRFVDYPGRVDLPFFFRLPWILKDLRKDKFDLSIVLDSNDPEAGPFSYLSGAPVRVGWQESGLSFLFTTPVKKRIENLHVVDIKFKALETIGIKPVERAPEIFLTEEEELHAEKILKSEGIFNSKIVGVHPFGAKRNRWWPEEYVVSLSDFLFEKHGFRTILFGGSKESPFAIRMARRMKQKPFVVAGRISIRESAALIKRCSFFVSPDSGPMHLAQAVGTPTIALFGPADPTITGPTGRKYIILKKELSCSPCKDYECPHFSCMKAISVEDVIAAIEEMKIKGWIGEGRG
ncbi:MAG: glycosyltransferase family 9 protein [Thermodesulfovibrionia bacterium]|nr:glycosyltransferase family 9 protein [Thermodesulfovibrionia bacterium]